MAEEVLKQKTLKSDMFLKVACDFSKVRASVLAVQIPGLALNLFNIINC